MTRRMKDPLRPLTEEERTQILRISRSQAEPASHVAHAKALLALADRRTYTAAAQDCGRCSGDAISHLVTRFNKEGLAALAPRHGGGPQVIYDAAAQQRILDEAKRSPDREKDGTATWSLKTLQRSLRQAPDGLPEVSTFTIWRTFRETNWSWQETRTWCETGKVKRKRKAGVVEVTDPDTTGKKT